MLATKTTAKLEQEYHDRKYARRTHAQHAIGLESFERQFLTPEHMGSGEDRGQIRGFAFETLLRENIRESVILDYACGDGRYGIYLSLKGARMISGFDFSPNAIKIATIKARKNSVEHKCRHQIMDASTLAYKDEVFDLCFGVAALHHVLKYPHVASELYRVMKRGAKAIFVENLGDNPILEFIRKFSLKNYEDGGEYILKRSDILGFARDFSQVQIEEFSLLYMAKRLLRKKYRSPFIMALLRKLHTIDRFIFKLAPPLKKYCGESVIILTK